MSYSYPYMQPAMNMQPTQARLSQMEQQFPQFAQPNYPQQFSTGYQSPGGLKGRPVSSYDEAKASMIDLDGSVFVFPDFGNARIYTKQINLDGTATINTYTLSPSPISTQNSVDSSKSEPNTSELINGLQSQIDSLKAKIEEMNSERRENYAEPVRTTTKHDAKSKSSNVQYDKQ